MSESENEDQQEPKIIVDTDWKEQVAREKEAVASGEEEDSPADKESADKESEDKESGVDESSVDSNASPESASVAKTAKEPDPDQPAGGPGELQPPPPASFDVLVSMLFTQAMALLGQMPDPGSGETIVNKPYAKHYIDTLEMLGEKTKGNLADEEEKMLSEALHALRMMYVNTR